MLNFKAFGLYIIAALCVVSANSQTPTGIQWQKSYGGTGSDFLRVVKETSDGGYIFAGESDSVPSGNKTSPCHGLADFWVVKVDAANNLQWQQSFGGSDLEQLSALQQTSDQGYILGGFSSSGISGTKTNSSFGGFDFWVVKIDSAGNRQWEKTFGGTGGDLLFDVRQTSDGGFILGGQSASGTNGNKTAGNFGNFDYWIIKLNSAGVKQWEQTYGGSGEDYLTTVQQTSDGGYLLGGGSISGVSGNKAQAGFGNFDFWVIKVDANGAKQWEQCFGGTGNDDFAALQQTTDGGYILGGYSNSGASGNKTDAGFGSSDFWIVKIDANGAKQWDRCYGGTNSESLFSLQQTSDGGYIFGGNSVSSPSGNKGSTNFGFQDFWVVKTDSQGNVLWDRSFGGTSNDALFSLQQTTDGGYLLGGRSQSGISGNKTSANFGTLDYWVLKFGTPLYFHSYNHGPGNSFQAQLVGDASTDYVFQASTNLVDWISVQTNNSAIGLIDFTDNEVSGFPQRFYRAIVQP